METWCIGEANRLENAADAWIARIDVQRVDSDPIENRNADSQGLVLFSGFMSTGYSADSLGLINVHVIEKRLEGAKTVVSLSSETGREPDADKKGSLLVSLLPNVEGVRTNLGGCTE